MHCFLKAEHQGNQLLDIRYAFIKYLLLETEMKLRILTDIEGLSKVHHANIHISYCKRFSNQDLLKRFINIILKYNKNDIFLMNFSKHILLLGLLKMLLPMVRCRLAVLDLFVPHPGNETTIIDKLKRYIITFCLKGIDLIFVYSADNIELCKAYRINKSKIKYIPFKVNGFEYVTKQATDDKGYIFSGGQSRRDYETLLESCKELPYPIKIITPNKEQAKIHGTLINETLIPSNVEIIHDDGSIESFVSYISNSKFVVIPTKKNDFASTGTSVYLMSMALKKCVVISSGPTTKGILGANMAVIVPPEDPLSLRNAIEKVYNDDTFRNAIAHNGYEYALSLGGLDTLYCSLLNEVIINFQPSEPLIVELAPKN